MGTIAVTTVLNNELHRDRRQATLLLTLSASYATGGDTLDLSAVTGGGFTLVHGIRAVGVGVSGAGNDKYHFTYVPATGYAPATCLLKIRDLSAASDAEVSNTTDLSAVTVLVDVVGK